MSKSNICRLAFDYHNCTKKISVNYSNSKINQYKIYQSSKVIILKEIKYNNDFESDFIQTIMNRKSTRLFSQEGIRLNELSQLLQISCGIRGADYSGLRLRTYPSAGALYPIEVYFMILRSDEIEKGIYHYNVNDNTFELVKKGNYTKQISDFYMSQEFVKDAPCLIFFSMIFERTISKYGERGYRFILLDAGHMSQNLYLTAEYLNLGLVALGAGNKSDDEIDDLIGLIHENENIFVGFAVGYPL